MNCHFKNMLYLFAGDVAGRLIGFLTVIYLARILGTDGFGIINTALALLSYAMLFGDLGMPVLGTREVAASEKEMTIISGQIILTRLVFSTATFLILTGTIYFGRLYPDIWVTIFIYLFYMFPAAAFTDWFFKGKQQMNIVAGGLFIGRLLSLIFILIFVSNSADTEWAAWGWTLGGLIQAGFFWFFFKQYRYKIQFSWQQFSPKKLLKASAPLGMASFISQAAIQFPVLYLGWFASQKDVGLFGAAFRLIVLMLVLDRIFYNVFFPAISRFAKRSPERLLEIVGKVAKIVVTAALIVCLLAIFSARFFVPLIFSEQYIAAIPLFQLMTAYFVFTIVNSVAGYTLIGAGYEKKFTRAFLWGLIILLLSMYPFQSMFGVIGVVGSLVLYHFTAMLLILFYLRKYLKLSLFRPVLPPLIGAFGILLPVFVYLDWQWLFNCTVILLAGLPFISWLAGVGKEEIDYLKEAIF